MKKLLVIFAAVLAFNTSAHADFPEKDITLIVPWSAGGGTDTIARALVQNAKKHIGVNVNVVNKTGGQGVVGMSATKTARADGYSVGLITFGLSTYSLMGLSDISYRDYELLQLLNQSSAALSVNKDSQFSTLEELMAYAKENPGIVTVGHTGAGGAWHLSAASLGVVHEADFNFIPFDGGAPTRSALLGKHVTVAATGIDEVKDLYEAGEVKILAANSLTRHPAFPEVPTLAEAGFDISAPVLDWRGLALPKGVPADRVEFLEQGFKKMFEDPDFRALAEQKGLILVYENSAGFKDFLANMEEVLSPTLDAVGLLK